MTTLNARASEAWNLVEAESEFGFESDEDAFVEGWEIGYRTRDAEATASAMIDRAAVDKALRKVIEFADYDLHKGIEHDEETGEDTYGEHVDRFIAEYGKAAS